MPVFDDDLDSAKQRSEEARSSAFHRTDFLKVEETEPAFIRIISPKPITLGMHSGIDTKTKPGELKKEAGWPATMWAICQNDKAFRVRDADGDPTDVFEDGYGSCYIHETQRGKKDTYKKDKSQARDQTFALAVLRKPVLDDDGTITDFKDVTEEFKAEDGTVSRIPKVVIVRQSYSNFWAPLKATMFMGPKSICGWDIVVTRLPDNKYSFGATGTPNLQPGKPGWERYEQTLELLGLSLTETLMDWSSPDWYARWFIEGQTPEGGYGRQDDDSDAAEREIAGAPAADLPSQEETDTFRNSLTAGRR